MCVEYRTTINKKDTMKRGILRMRRCTYVFCLSICFSIISEIPYQKKSYSTLVFMYGLLTNSATVGAITPSSSYVAQELVRPLSAHIAPKRILEIGAGTGQITDTIVHQLTAHDTLDVVELQKDFCDILVKRYEGHENVTIFCGSILDWHAQEPYDFIICTLPFNRFSHDLVHNILDHVAVLIAPQGVFSYIELKYLTYLKQLFLSRQQLQEHALVSTYMQNFNGQYCKEKVMVFRNFPPAQIFHCRFRE